MGIHDSSTPAGSLAGPAAALDDPFAFLTDEVKACYVRCAYKWSFHHTPSLLASIHRRTLDPCLAWAILAIAVRFSQTPPTGYPSQIDASNAFASRARALVLPCVDEPALPRIQVLLLLTGHSWGAGEGRRAWFYLGMAVRMAQSLGLLDEERRAQTSSSEFLAAEERRRTAWTCFLMDSILSGGKARDRTLSADKMRIQLPCDADSFLFGEPVRCPMLEDDDDDDNLTDEGGVPAGRLDMIGYTMRVANIWGDVARWACSPRGPDEPPPWDASSGLQRLLARLEAWRASLPPRLRYDLRLLRAHSVSNQGQAYCYMHAIYHVSVICLYRSYLPDDEPGRAAASHLNHPGSTSIPGDGQRQAWSRWSSEELASVAERVCEMLHEMRGFGLFFLRGLVPCVGFAGYTAVGALLYFFHFPFAGAGDARVSSWRARVVEGCDILKEMRQAWPMADTWRNTIQRMQFFYAHTKAGGTAVSSTTEGRALHDAALDYGALQLSPVGQPEQRQHGPEPEPGPAIRPEKDAVVEGMPSPQSEFDNGVNRGDGLGDGNGDVGAGAGYFGLEPFSTDMPLLMDSVMDTTMTVDMDMAGPPMFVNASQGFWGGFLQDMQ